MASSIPELLEHLFSTPNPTTGSLPPPHTAWVVFANGTVFYSTPTDTLPVDATFDELAEAARSALIELGPPVAGTDSADFNPLRLDNWFPDEPVWLVQFVVESIVTMVTMDAPPINVGLSGRARRQLDLEQQSVLLVRRFDGTSRPS